MNRLLLEYISKILSESSPASEQAKQMGLDYMGFGQWGKGGRVTHKNADKDGTMLVVYKPKTEDTAAEPKKDTKKRKSSYSSYPEIQAEDLNAASLADKIREGIVAPGNDFSKYQEAVSVFIAKYIVDNPEATDQEIMERIVLLDCGSKLLTKDVKATLPKKYTNDYNDLKQAGVFSTCSKDYKDDQHKARFATMLFAKRKAELMLSGIEKANLDSPRIDSFSGDQDSLNSLLTLVKSSTGKIYSAEGNELLKDEVIESIGGFGTSKFPADTSLIAIDRFGNMVFVGYSDKKDLNAIINNSTVTSEISSHVRVLDSLLDREVLSQELYDDLAGSLHTLEGEYNNIENELKTATLSPARDLVEINRNNPEQLTELVTRAKRLSGGKTPDKYFTKLTGPIRAAYKNRNSKIFKLWEPLLTQVGWDGENEPAEEQMLAVFAIKSFEVLDTESSGGWNSYPVSRGEDTLTKDAQELLFRLMVPVGSPQRKEFVENVGIIRDRSLQILTEAREQLDKVTVGLEDGSSVKLGTYLDAIQAWRALHLDMSKYDGSLVMAAEDIIVDASDLIRCMKGVETDEEFAKTLDISTKRITDRSYGTVTGQNVEIFAISPEGKRIKIGTRSIRSKDGILGKLQTTYNYHKDFQQCLREKSGGKLNEGIKPSKLLLEYISKFVGESSPAAQQAKKLGLTSMGFGRWGKDGKVTHISSGGGSILTPFIPTSQDRLPRSSTVPSDSDTSLAVDTQTPSKISEVGRKKLLSVISARKKFLDKAIRTESAAGKKTDKLNEYKETIEKLISSLNQTPPNIQEIKNILNEAKITSYRTLMDSPLFGPIGDAGVSIKLSISKMLNSHLPGLLSGTFSESERGTKSRIATKSLFPDQDSFPIQRDEQRDGEVALGNTVFRRINVTEKQVENHLNQMKLSGNVRENRKKEILTAINVHNRRIDFIEKHGQDGFIKLPTGEEGSRLLQDRLSTALFEVDEDMKEFNALTNNFKSANSQEDIDVTWQELQKFLSSKFPEGGVIPTICEHLTAIRAMQTDSSSTIFMPSIENFPIADVIVVKELTESQRPEFELINITYEIDMGSVKRGISGAPSSISEQMSLTVMSDDVEVGGNGKSRNILDGLIAGNSDVIEDAIKLVDNIDVDEDTIRFKNLTNRALKCICKPRVTKKCMSEHGTSAQEFAKNSYTKEILYKLIYDKYVKGQAFSNTTFRPDGITESNGKSKLSGVSPDYRVKCEDGNAPEHYVYRGRAYLSTPK
jgi:hypothetical protein